MGKKEQKDSARVDAVLQQLRKQAPLTVKQVFLSPSLLPKTSRFHDYVSFAVSFEVFA